MNFESGEVKTYLLSLQNRIVAELERLDGMRFASDVWQRDTDDPAGLGGGGDTRIIEQGALFERGGVAFSHVSGGRLPASATAARPELAGRDFEAMGCRWYCIRATPTARRYT